MKCRQRLYLTKDKETLVGEGDKAAATLYAVPGDEIPASAAERFGLVDGALKGFKEDKSGGDKEKKDGADKGGGKSGEKGADPAGDDLAKLSGVGAKTAGALAQAGLASFAAIAAVDPANPPQVEGLPAVFAWAKVVESAKALAGAPSGGEG